MAEATAQFEITAWQEGAYDEAEGTPGTSATEARAAYTGDLEGEGSVRALTVHGAGDAVAYLWQERFTGRLGDRTGTFVLQGGGTWADDTARYRLTVAPGSATGDLEGLTGEARIEAGHGAPGRLTLVYELG